jgi:hypothetical protein
VRRTSPKTDPIREATINALATIFDPLLALAFDVGLSVQELNHLLRWRAVHVAVARLLRESGQRSNSRIAIITGIPRSEVAKLLRFSKTRGRATVSLQPARRMLNGWFTDPKFLNSLGKPAVLPIFGKRRSFESLVAKYGVGIPVRAMLDELVQIGAIERLPNQRANLKACVPGRVSLNPDAIEAIGEHCKYLLDTLIQNLRGLDRRMFETTFLTSDASSDDLPLIRKEIAEQGTHLVKAASSILKRPQSRTNKGTSKRKGRRVGVTIFYFEDSADPSLPGDVKRRTNLCRRP